VARRPDDDRSLSARARRLALVVSVALGLAIAAPAASRAADREESASEILNGLLESLLGLGEMSALEVQKVVGEAGGVPFTSDVPVQFMTKDALGRYLRELVDAEYPPSDVEADTRTLIAFDLLEPGTDLGQARLKLLEENIAGFYDERPDRRRLYVVSSDAKLTPMNQIILAHELRHALQDQHASVHGIIPKDVGDFDDRRMAFLSLLEGDATLVMGQFLSRRIQGAELPAPDLSDFAFPVSPMPGTPAVLRDQMVLPYVIGTPFARELRSAGGWDAVRRAWSRPPESTEQVLHPEKFQAGERPREVAVTYAPGSGKLLREGVLGELFARTLLGDEAEEEAAAAAAAGWGGDRFKVWDRSGATLLVWHATWDTEDDAREFALALDARFDRTHERQSPRGGATVFRKASWSVATERRGSDTWLVSSDEPAVFQEALAGLNDATKGGPR